MAAAPHHLLLVLALGTAACAPEEPGTAGSVPRGRPARAESPGAGAQPADAAAATGVVLRVDGLELTAADVEPLARDIAALYPEYSTAHVRRLALTNELLTRLALRAVDPAGWEAARAAAAAADPEALEPERARGGFNGLGVSLWSAARHLEPGEWSGPIELAGRWVRIRLDAREPHPDPRQEELELAWLEFPFVPPEEARARMDAALDATELTIVDPAWEETVPEYWKHRMRGSNP